MRFTLEERQGYIVRVGTFENEELHIVTMKDAADTGLRFKSQVELVFPGGPYTDDRRVTGTVVGTLSEVKDAEELAL